MAKDSNSKFEVVTIKDVKLTIDLSDFHKTESPWFNATEIAKSHGKRVLDWLRNDDTVAYVRAIEIMHPEFKDDKFCFKGEPDSHLNNKLIRVVKGKYGGTYLHKRLALQFARWCSPEFAVALDDWIIQKVESERKRKDARLEALTGFKPLTEAIRDSHKNPQPYHYSNEVNMHYQIVTGKQAKQLRKEMNITENQRPIDFLPEDQIRAIAMLRKFDEGLIRIGMDYEERKHLLTKYNNSSKLNFNMHEQIEVQ